MQHRTVGRIAWIVAACVLGGCRGTPPSIVMAVLDTVRTDDVSAYGEVGGTTPTLDGLARNGLRYARAYSNANWTFPSHATLFTGRLPHDHGVRTSADTLRGDVPTLAERLQAAGYETVAFAENIWLTGRTGMTRGFERFTYVTSSIRSGRTGT